MVNFVLDMTVSGSATPIPTVPKQAAATALTDKWYEIVCPKSTWAALFPVKFTGDMTDAAGTDWTDPVSGEDFTDGGGSVPSSIATILGTTWDTKATAVTSAAAQSGYKATDFSNDIASLFFGANIAGEIFDNEAVVLSAIQTGLDGLLTHTNTNGAEWFLKRMIQDDVTNAGTNVSTWASGLDETNMTSGTHTLPFQTGDTIQIALTWALTADNPISGVSAVDCAGSKTSGHINITLA